MYHWLSKSLLVMKIWNFEPFMKAKMQINRICFRYLSPTFFSLERVRTLVNRHSTKLNKLSSHNIFVITYIVLIYGIGVSLSTTIGFCFVSLLISIRLDLSWAAVSNFCYIVVCFLNLTTSFIFKCCLMSLTFSSKSFLSASSLSSS